MLSLTACQEPPPPPPPRPAASTAPAKAPAVSAASILERAKPLFAPLPASMQDAAHPATDAQVELGRLLYHDVRLSKNHDLSCNTCHDLASGGIDVREREGRRSATSAGHRGQLGGRNSPTVYNAALQLAQFWDGRAATVEDQAKGPILNPIEMAMPSEAAVLAAVGSIPEYAAKFSAAFPDAKPALTYDNLAAAIAAFERRLVTPAPFDDFLQGKVAALGEEQLRGLQLFLDVGCTQCHTGPGLGGTMYQKLGSVKPYETKDAGRFDATKNEADRGVFKVPILRNIEKTAPYFHDGSVATLEEAVRLMTLHQTTKGTLTPDEMNALLAFLRSLTGTPPAGLVDPPAALASGPSTPKPDPT
jgi:cytochrome c peroxidase